MKNEGRNLKKIEYIAATILALVMLFISVSMLRFGVDVQDTSSYLTLYRYFFEKGTGGNSLYYMLGEFFGSLIYHTFPTLYALNVAGLIVYLLVGILVYRIMKPYLSTLPLTLAVAGGLGFGVSWVRCVNWNSWSMLFLSLGILFLLHGFDTNEKRWLYFAGLVLGFNTYVRMPNLLFLGLVLAVAFFYINDGWKLVISKCGKMAAGGMTAGIIGAVFGVLFLGHKTFWADISCLIGSLGDKESEHYMPEMFSKFFSGAIDGVCQWVKYGILIGAVIGLCIIIRKLWKKDVTVFGTITAIALAMYIGLTRDVTYSSMPSLLSVQNFIAYGGMAFGLFGAIRFYKTDKRFAVLCIMEAMSMIFLTIGTNTGSIYFRVFMALPAAIIAAVLMKLPVKEFSIMAVFVLVLTFATGANCNMNYVYHDGEYGEALDSTINSPVFEGVYTTSSRAKYVNRLIELLTPYEEKELLTIGAFNIGHNVTDMKTFYNCAWTDLDYLEMHEFNGVLEKKLEAGNAPVVVVGTEKINGPYWAPHKVKIIEELVHTDLYECIYEDEWYSVHVPIN